MAPVVKKGRKPGRGGRGKSRGGGRGGGRPQNSTAMTQSLVLSKRDRSPSGDSSKAIRGKAAKLVPSSIRKSQESPRSLRSRGGQNQNCPSPADEAPTAIHNQYQRSSRRKTDNEDAEMSNSSFGSPTNESWKSRSVPSTSAIVPKALENGATSEFKDGSSKRIPRLIDVSAANRREALSCVAPLEWTSDDVAQFLRVNDCTAYCDTFTKAVIMRSTSIDLVQHYTSLTCVSFLVVGGRPRTAITEQGPGVKTDKHEIGTFGQDLRPCRPTEIKSWLRSPFSSTQC